MVVGVNYKPQNSHPSKKARRGRQKASERDEERKEGGGEDDSN